MTSFCTSCLQGSCRLHPLLDHGRRANSLKEQTKHLTSKLAQQNLSTLLKNQIQRLEEDRMGTSMGDIERHRNLLEDERNRLIAENSNGSSSISSKKRKKVSELSSSGLNPTVIAHMIDSEEDDEEEEEDSESKSESSSTLTFSDGESDSKEKKKKKDKKKREKSKEKRKEKEKKKKEKKKRNKEKNKKRSRKEELLQR